MPLRDSFELIFRQSPIAMALTRRDDGTIIELNDACCALLGVDRDTAVGRRSLDLGTWTSPEERAAVIERLKRDGRVHRYETRLVRGPDVRLSFEPFTLYDDLEAILVIVEDITDWRAAEEELRVSEARWHYALEGSDSGVWDWNAQTNQVFFSDRWKSMLGYAPHEVGTSLDEWSSRVHPDDLEETMRQVTDHLEGRTPEYVSEHRVRHKDGTWRWILDRGQVVTRDASGGAVRVVGTHTDITARREAEERRHEQEQRFRAIFDSAFQFIGLLKPDGTVLEANRTALDFAGLSPEDVVGRPFWEARWWQVNDGVVQRLRDAIAAAARGEFVRYESVVLGRGDARTVIDFSIKPLRDAEGRVTLLVPEGRDIGDIRRAQADLFESEERFRTAFESAAIGMAIVSPDGRFRKVNRALCELLGYEAPELTRLTFQEITHPDDLEADLDQARRLAAGEIRSYQMEKRYFHRDGHVIWIRLVGSAVRDASGVLVSYLAQIEDVTARREAQAALERALLEKDQLLHEVHHRVKNNLQVISSLLNLQQRAVADPVTREALDDSQRRVQAMALVHQCLYQGSSLAAIDMQSYLQELVGHVCRSATPRGVDLRTRLDADPITVPIDVAIPCGLILNELLSNVLRYAFAGRTSGGVEVQFRREGDRIALSVYDDGVGLPEAPRAGSIGMRLVDGLARQLRGTFTLGGDSGVHAVVRFPAPDA